MQRLRFILLILSIFVTLPHSINIRGEEVGSKSTVLTQHRKTNRPEMPSRERIICTYVQGHIEFDFNNSEYLDVTISKDDIPIWYGTITQDEPSADIPVLYGEYTITCITDGGHIFTGYLNF